MSGKQDSEAPPADQAHVLGKKTGRAAQRRWLPEGRQGPMPWIIAIMMFLTILAGAGGLGLAHALVQMRGDLAGGYTVQVIEANAARRANQVAQITSYLKEEKAVRRFTVVPQNELLHQLEPWIGADVQTDELPIPALIDIETIPDASTSQIDEIARRIKTVAPSAGLDAHERYLAPVEQLMSVLMWLAAGLVVLMTIVTGAVVALAARSAHDTHRATIDIMHLLGATDTQIARLFQRRIALDALFGGAVGTLASALLLWPLVVGLAATESELANMVVLPWRYAVLLLAIPLLGVLVAATTARITVKRALERSL